MNKFILVSVIVLISGGVFFVMAKDSKPETQNTYKVVAFGDSLTAGYDVEEMDSYPSVLQDRLRLINPNVSILNMGVSGETSAGGLKRIDDIIMQKPNIVLLGLGGNDMLRSIKPSEVKLNLESVVQKLQAEGITVVLMGMRTSLNSSTEYRKEFNAIYPDLAEKYNIVLVPFFLEGVALKSDLNLPDRLHPNRAGYMKIVDENIMPVVKGLFR